MQRLAEGFNFGVKGLTVWCGIACFGILRSCFFEDNEGSAVTATSDRYVAKLLNFCEPDLLRRGIDL
jgi:hypothetical protein